MEIRFWLDLDDSSAYHARLLTDAEVKRLAKFSIGSRMNLISRLALNFGDRLIAWGKALKKRARGPRAMSSMKTGYAD